MFLHIAMYLRLSQEDVDKRNNVLKDESNSIRSQRLLIQRYIQEHSELSGCPVMEFVDAPDIIGLKQNPTKRASL